MSKLRIFGAISATVLSAFALSACGESSNTVTEDSIRENLIAVQEYSGETQDVTASAFCETLTPQYQKYGQVVSERATFESEQDATPEQLYGNLVAQQEIVQSVENTVRGSKVTDNPDLETLRTAALNPSSDLIGAYTSMKSGDIGLSELDSKIGPWETATSNTVLYCIDNVSSSS